MPNKTQNDTLIQFETDDITIQRRKRNRNNNNWKTIVLVSITLITFSLVIYKSHQVTQLEESLSTTINQKEEMEAYFKSHQNQQIFTERNEVKLTEKEILDQIFYPHGSHIIETLEELALLRNWTGKAGFHMILKSSVSGDDRENFQKKTRKGKSLLVLVKTKKGHRFGAYTSLNFQPREHSEIIVDVTKNDDKAFLFSLDKKEKYQIKNSENAIICDENIAFMMGDGDLVIKDQFMKKPSVTDFPKSFEGDSSNKLGLTFGDKEFVVEELEVYQVYSS